MHLSDYKVYEVCSLVNVPVSLSSALRFSIIQGSSRVFSGLLGFIVDAATEEAPELPKCKRCGRAEAEQPGCILVCRACGVECNDWRDASPKHHCFKVCEDCYSCRVCMKCNKAPASRKEHQNSSKMRIHRRLSTHLYGTQKAGRITGSSLTIAGTVGCAVPVVGWAVGPALITGRMRK